MRSGRTERGFTMIELVIVIAVILILTGGALMNVFNVTQKTRDEAGLQVALGQLRNARDLAIGQRRKYRVTFTAPRTVQLDLVVYDSSGNRTFQFVSSTTLPQDLQFTTVSGIPTGSTNTPDYLPTTGAAIDFSLDFGGAGTEVFFYPDGRAVDSSGRSNSGVVYLARPGDLMSSRAVSVLSATGRIKGWRLIKKGSTGVMWTE